MKISVPAVGFSALYSTHFVFLGLLLPFFSGWLALQGFSPSAIGLINGVALVARLAIGPLIAVMVDREIDKRKPLLAVSCLFALSGLLLIAFDNSFLIAVAAVLVIWCFGLLVPLTDSMVLRADRAGVLDYGPVRAMGSLAFLVTTIIGGMVFDRLGLASVGAGLAGACVAALVMALLLPASAASMMPPAEPSPREAPRGALRWRDAARLITNPVFLLALFAAGLTQGAHAVYYAYSILHWSGLGFSNTIIGWLWAVGVIAEIMLLARARALARRLDPVMLFGIGAGASVVRWSLTALEPSLLYLFAVQSLHGLTFTATYLGSLEFIDRAVPHRLTNTGMMLFSATGVGALTGFATVGAGFIYEAYGPRSAYLMMALMGVGALILAMVLRRMWDGGKII